jgi:uncharacterized Tic20 family protein
MAPSELKPAPLPPVDTRIASAFAHASILFPGIGIFVPVILWSYRRKYSLFVRNQALQALVFQLLQWIWIQLIALIVFLVVFVYASISTANHLTPEVYSNRMLTSIIASVVVIAICWFSYLLFGVIGAVVCLTGHNFRYPLLGNWIDRYTAGNQNLSSEPKGIEATITDDISGNETIDTATGITNREYQLIASVSHASILIPLVGFLVPFFLATMDKEKSQQNRFQVMQALTFQLLGQVINFLLFGCQLVMVFSVGIPIVLMNLGGQLLTSEPVVFVVGLIIILLMLTNFFILLVMPLLATFGIIASVQVLRGKKYHYPILGRKLAKKWVHDNALS